MMQDFVQAIKDLIRSEIENIHTAIPGKIVSFDPAKGLATVLPTMKFKTPNGKTLDYPQITDVPVLFPQGNGKNASVAFPLKAGDGCLIIVSEKPIDLWMFGQQTDTDLPFDLTNAICIPGLFNTGNADVAQACNENAVVIRSGSAKIVLKNGSATVTANTVTVNGNLNVNGKISATGEVSAGSVKLKEHTHPDIGSAPSAS